MCDRVYSRKSLVEKKLLVRYKSREMIDINAELGLKEMEYVDRIELGKGVTLLGIYTGIQLDVTLNCYFI
jgi:hypothetical protein